TEPVDAVTEEKDDSAQARSQQDTSLHEEPDEQIEPTKETAKTTEPVDVAAEEKDDSAQARSQQDTSLHEEPDEQIEPTKETAKTAEVVDDVTKEKDDSVQAKPDQEAGQSEEPDEENVQAAGRSTTAKPEDPNDERQAQADPDRGSLGDPPLEQASVPRPKTELIAESPKGPNEESVQPKIETKTVDLGNGVLIEFKFGTIPAGEFLMGSGMGTKNGASDGNPAQRVTISKPFYMSVHEVTQEQYEKVMGKNPSRFPGPKRPVETVSWYDAQEFCRQLSEVGSIQCRLPTEAEWEYACRAGTTTAYYWGDNFDSRYAWTLADREAKTCDVGAKQHNDWGLYDMSGNVWEWCSDWYARRDLSSTELTDPQGPDGGTFRVLRGGSWGHSRVHCRSGHRNWHTPNHRYDDCGFRIVMEVEQTPEAPPAP
ncbi:MAG: formylglycine-generating enzyme family protein, partial [Planctomycetota bacterium]